MRLCIPVIEEKGIESRISDHFGSAPFFLIFDTDAKSAVHVANSNQHHDHGKCSPMSVLSAYRLDAVVCVGMGRGAIAGLNAAGVKTYLSKGCTAGEVIDRYEAGALAELSVNEACGRHGCS